MAESIFTVTANLFSGTPTHFWADAPMASSAINDTNAIFFISPQILFTAAKIAITAETTKHILGKRHRFVTIETIGTGIFIIFAAGIA